MQLRNARLSISFREAGNFTEIIPRLSKKLLLPIFSIPSGISTCFRLVRNFARHLPSNSIIRRISTAIVRTSEGISIFPATASTALGIRTSLPSGKEKSVIRIQPVKTSQIPSSCRQGEISSFFSRTSLTNTCFPRRSTPGIRTSVRLSQ